MKIILLQDIKALGKKNDVKEVSDGYARNFLIPKKLARIATPEAIKEIEKLAQRKEREAVEAAKQLNELSEKLKTTVLNFYLTVGKNQEVFESINKDDIKEAIIKKLINNPSEAIKRKIKVLLAKSLKTIGEHQITVLIGEEKIKTKVILNQNRLE